MQPIKKARLQLILSMVIFGTIGIFRKYIPLPSGMMAMLRGLVGAGFLMLLLVFRKEKLSFPAIRKNLWPLLISGGLIGFNWILLFEAYRYTTVATATLCYYMAPVFVMLAAPVVLKESLSAKKLLCIAVAFIGMVLVSGVLNANAGGSIQGVLLGLGAALLYGSVMLINQKIRNIGAYDKTIVQLFMAAVVLIPYVLAAESLQGVEITPLVMLMMVIVCIVHTGVAYALYFGSMDDLKAQTVALFSYIDPIVAVILSALLLKEEMALTGWIGATLILGATLFSELPEKRRK